MLLYPNMIHLALKGEKLGMNMHIGSIDGGCRISFLDPT